MASRTRSGRTFPGRDTSGAHARLSYANLAQAFLALIASGLACGGSRPHSTTTGSEDAAESDTAQSADTAPTRADLRRNQDVTGPDQPPENTDVPEPACGDGLREFWEACDDGNNMSGDGCADDCRRVEIGFHCMWPGRPCTPNCGDGQRVGGETCDDGNLESGDGCSELCLVEPGWECSSRGCAPAGPKDGGLDATALVLFCGDGIRSGAEECDFGPLNGDAAQSGCSRNCHYTNCGDGMIDGPEQCDLGADNVVLYGNPNGCTPWCRVPGYCGDGIVDNGYEMCDLGPSNGDPRLCNATCTRYIY